MYISACIVYSCLSSCGELDLPARQNQTTQQNFSLRGHIALSSRFIFNTINYDILRTQVRLHDAKLIGDW